MSQHIAPEGIRFHDLASRRSMIFVTDGPWYGWLCYRHSEGQWVSLRKATDEERRTIIVLGILSEKTLMPVRELTSHKINGVNGGLDVHVMDEPGPGGACRHYRATFSGGPGDPAAEVLTGVVDLVFQDGNPAVIGTNGLTNEALLAILIDRLYGFQAGPAACNENAYALANLEHALAKLKARTMARVERGVEGTLTP